jgi:hypothetical protein
LPTGHHVVEHPPAVGHQYLVVLPRQGEPPRNPKESLPDVLDEDAVDVGRWSDTNRIRVDEHGGFHTKASECARRAEDRVTRSGGLLIEEMRPVVEDPQG